MSRTREFPSIPDAQRTGQKKKKNISNLIGN